MSAALSLWRVLRASPVATADAHLEILRARRLRAEEPTSKKPTAPGPTSDRKPSTPANECNVCNGSGTCQRCDGAGEIDKVDADGKADGKTPCPECRPRTRDNLPWDRRMEEKGDGKCANCGGTGKREPDDKATARARASQGPIVAKVARVSSAHARQLAAIDPRQLAAMERELFGGR